MVMRREEVDAVLRHTMIASQLHVRRGDLTSIKKGGALHDPGDGTAVDHDRTDSLECR